MTDTQIDALREIVGRMTPGEFAIDPLMGDCSIITEDPETMACDAHHAITTALEGRQS